MTDSGQHSRDWEGRLVAWIGARLILAVLLLFALIDLVGVVVGAQHGQGALTSYFIVIVAVIGLVRKQPRRYWYHVLGAVWAHWGLLYLALALGFAGRRLALALGFTGRLPFNLPFLAIAALVWGVPLWIVVRGYVRKAGAEAVTTQVE